MVVVAVEEHDAEVGLRQLSRRPETGETGTDDHCGLLPRVHRPLFEFVKSVTTNCIMCILIITFPHLH